MAGEFQGWIDFGGTRFESPPVDDDGYLACFDATGAHRWSLHLAGIGTQAVAAAAYRADGDAIVAGSFVDYLSWDDQVRSSKGGLDLYVARVDPMGELEYFESFGGELNDNAAGVAVTPQGDFVVAGPHNATINFGGTPLEDYGEYVAAFGERFPPPTLVISVFSRGSTIVARWDVATEETLDSVAVVRNQPPGTEVEVFRDAFGTGQGEFVDHDVVGGRTYQYQLVVTTPQGAKLPFVNGHDDRPSSFTNTLAQNAPNPFNPSTSIDYSVSARADVAVEIFDVSGVRVRRLEEGVRDAGEYAVEWDGRDDAGNVVGTGVYFYRLEGVAGVAPRKMVLLK